MECHLWHCSRARGLNGLSLAQVSCEALIAASSKKDKCRAIMTQGTNILKQLFHSKSDAIKVRALVGLCKLGSLGGTDATMRPFAEGASLKLAEACRRWVAGLRGRRVVGLR